MKSTPWSDQRVEELKSLWAEGFSASQIASRLGEVTRNAVVGKVHRLGLAGRATTSRIKTLRPRRQMMRSKPTTTYNRSSLNKFLKAQPAAFKTTNVDGAASPYEELVIPVQERACIQTLNEASCRWPIGDPQHQDFHFCNKQKIGNLPYCEFHARRAFQPTETAGRRRVTLLKGSWYAYKAART